MKLVYPEDIDEYVHKEVTVSFETVHGKLYNFVGTLVRRFHHIEDEYFYLVRCTDSVIQGEHRLGAFDMLYNEDRTEPIGVIYPAETTVRTRRVFS